MSCSTFLRFLFDLEASSCHDRAMRRIGSQARDGVRSAPREQLLYVEDDDSNWQVAELRLGRSYDLVRASSDEQACKVLAARGGQLAAILMDIELRGSQLDGLQLTQLIRGKLERSRLPAYATGVPVLDVPVIFVTAHGADYPGPALFAAGGQRVLGKPVDFSALTLALTQFHLERMGRRRG